MSVEQFTQGHKADSFAGNWRKMKTDSFDLLRLDVAGVLREGLLKVV